RGTHLQGQVVFPAGEEIAHREYRVLALARDLERTRTHWPRAFLNSQGEFEFSELPAGRYWLAVTSHGERRWVIRFLEPMTLSGQERTTISIPFREVEPGTLVIHLADVTGTPLARAAVTLERSRTGTQVTLYADASGVFRMDLHPDRFRVILNASGFQEKVLEDVLLKEGEELALQVVLDEAPDLHDSLSAVLGSLGSFVIEQPISLRLLFDLINHLEPGVVALDPALKRSGLLETGKVEGPRSGAFDAIVARVIHGYRLSWEVDGGQLRIGAPTRFAEPSRK
ncbi:MAG: carboxypeptidase-like regulatory domain-containing protein, partial [Planctomycetota bacterium]